MNLDQPQITVLLSTYNSRRFVEKKLREIRNQSIYSRAEFVFIETASPERERELLAPFCAAHPNCKLITTDERRTLYEAWNLGWDAARAPLICYSNMDDSMHPRLLEHVVAAMHRKSWAACTVLIGKQFADDPALDDWSLQRLRTLPIGTRPGPFSAWRTELKSNIGAFDGKFVSAGDLDFWARIVTAKLPVGVVGKLLYLYTKSPGQLSKSGHFAHLRDVDWQRLAQKPYAIRWSRAMRWQIYFYRALLRMSPRAVCVAA